MTHSKIAFKYFDGSVWTEGDILGQNKFYQGKTLVEIGELILNNWEIVILLNPVPQPTELVYLDSRRNVYHFTTEFFSSDKLNKCFERLRKSEKFMEPNLV